MDLGWKVLIPVALGWFLLIGAMEVADARGWPLVPVVLVGMAVMAGGALLLIGAVSKARAERLADLERVELEGESV
jgi:NADH-quinone oxidoreductase subunit H